MKTSTIRASDTSFRIRAADRGGAFAPDFLPVTLAERLTDACPGATLGVVPDSGHFLLDDAFDPVGVMILEYLRVRYQGAPHGHDGIVLLQLERRPPWVDLAPDGHEDDEPAAPGHDQEVGPHA